MCEKVNVLTAFHAAFKGIGLFPPAWDQDGIILGIKDYVHNLMRVKL